MLGVYYGNSLLSLSLSLAPLPLTTPPPSLPEIGQTKWKPFKVGEYKLFTNLAPLGFGFRID